MGKPRTAVDWSKPVLLGETSPANSDTYEDRLDHNDSGRGAPAPFRARKGSAKPLHLSDLYLADALATFAPLWRLAEKVDAEMPEVRTGRPRKSSTFEIILFEALAWVFTSSRSVDDMLADPWVWARLTRVVDEAYPDRLDRRLSPTPPTRNRYQYLRDRYLLDDRVQEVIALTLTQEMCDVAVEIGRFSGKGSFTHPDPSGMVIGDATWIAGAFNRNPNDPPCDPKTGEVRQFRVDPDAAPFHPKDERPGRAWVSVTAPTLHPHERLLLAFDVRPLKGPSDATVFTDMVLSLRDLIEIEGGVYDMALHAADIDRLMDAGIIAVSKVQRQKGGKLTTRNLGVHPFRSNGREQTAELVAVDGTPCVIGHDADGNEHYVPLSRTQTIVRPFKNRRTLYAYWRVPNTPAAPRSLRGLKTLVRHSSTQEEREENRRVTRALRPIPESDPDFGPLYGLREDVESMHNHLKQMLINKRARTVGLARQRLNVHGYQALLGVRTLIAWHRRTGGDLERWFGAWKPPGSVQLPEAGGQAMPKAS